ncbi:MAG: hypothetical protein KDH94_02345, partial [Coxiellaceae bacterium]|nr:hypothetical protein [Coxiellaceae bacterium]
MRNYTAAIVIEASLLLTLAEGRHHQSMVMLSLPFCDLFQALNKELDSRQFRRDGVKFLVIGDQKEKQQCFKRAISNYHAFFSERGELEDKLSKLLDDFFEDNFWISYQGLIENSFCLRDGSRLIFDHVLLFSND